MPNELSEKVYPDGTVVKLRDDTAREQIADVTEVKTISGTGSYSCTYTAYKYGRVVMLKVRNVVNSTTGQGMDLFYLPQGWRPVADTDAPGRYNYGGFNITSDGVNFRAEAAGGKVWTYSYKAFTNGGGADFVYICAE